MYISLDTWVHLRGVVLLLCEALAFEADVFRIVFWKFGEKIFVLIFFSVFPCTLHFFFCSSRTTRSTHLHFYVLSIYSSSRVGYRSSFTSLLKSC